MPASSATALLLGLLACGDGDSTLPPPGQGDDTAAADTGCVGAPGVTWSSWGHGFFATYCAGCHASASPDRHGAPDDVSFDTLAQVRDQVERIRARTLDSQDMPPGGGVVEDDLWLLEVFLDCGL